MGSLSNSIKSGHHHPLTYSVSMASMPTAPGRAIVNGQHRRLNRSASEPVAQLQQQQPRPTTINNANRYKTELCRPFEENGLCKYGDKCQFAHGIAELRNLVRHPKYKTELCRTFHSSGFCPYGPRCHFIHNDTNRNPIISPGQQSSNINIPSAVDSIISNGVELPNVDIILKDFNRPGSSGDLSPNTSSTSGSPTSCNGFPVETDNLTSRFSPPPHSAPPFITNNAFFGQGFVPFPSMVPSLQQQQQQQPISRPVHTQKFVPSDWQRGMAPPPPALIGMSAATGRLSLCPKNNTSTSSMPSFPGSSIPKLRLPIFSQIVVPHHQFVGMK